MTYGKINKEVNIMKQCSINGIKVSYIPYGDAILLMESVAELNIMNGLIIPYSTIKNGLFTWHDKQYPIYFLDN